MSVYANICYHDLVTKFLAGLENRTYMLAGDGKIWATGEYEGHWPVGHDRPWHYINSRRDMNCDWFHDISKMFGFIPTRCLNCWKVVVRPRTLQELFKLQGLMVSMVDEDPECYCKCGIELRPWVFGNYGGYFYQTSKEAMQERYKQVRQLVTEKIDPAVQVIPKRYCSEFERDFGPSDQYKRTDEDDHWEELIKEHCHMVQYPHTQPDLAIQRTIHEWFKHAWNVGDPTVLIYTEGKPLVRPVVAYYPEQEDLGDSDRAETGE